MKFKLVIEFEGKHPNPDVWRSEIYSLIEDKMKEVGCFAEKMTGKYTIYSGQPNEILDLSVKVI